MSAVRRADVQWSGDLASGTGTVSASSSQAFGDLPVSWAARTESPGGKTSPEELLAAAHGGCLSMSLAGELTSAGSPPERLDVNVKIVMDEVPGKGHLVIASEAEVVARVPGIDQARFDAAVRAADEGCSFSALIRASASVTVRAQLEST